MVYLQEVVWVKVCIISLDHEIVQLLDTVGMLWVYQTSQRNWVTIKVQETGRSRKKGGSGTVIEGNAVEIKDGRCDHNRK